MNKRLFVVALLFLALLCSAPSFAHGGKTDENGGHKDTSTGEYHYHHGYPAHQHPGGDCPYDFDDKTGENSGGSSTTDSSNYMTPDPEEMIIIKESAPPVPSVPAITGTPKPTPTQPPRPSATLYSANKIYYDGPCFTSSPSLSSVAPSVRRTWTADDSAFSFGLLSLVLLMLLLYSFSKRSDIKKELKNSEYRERLLSESVSSSKSVAARVSEENSTLRKQISDLSSDIDDLRRAEADSREDFERMRGKFKRMRAGYLDIKWYLELQGGVSENFVVPPHVTIGEDGLPCGDDASERVPWGESYTFFCTPGRSTFHRHGCAHAGILRVHALDVPGMIPCKTCHPELPDLSWYDDYVRIRKMKQDYNL